MTVPLLMVLSAAIGPALVTRPGFGKRSERGACQHPAPGRKQSSSADREKVETEPGGKLSAEIGASAADLHRTVLPWVRLFRRQDAKRLEDANRL